MGSPTSFAFVPLAPSSAATREWHAARTAAAAFVLARSGSGDRGAASLPPASRQTTPMGTRRSVVSVPVLSKRQYLTRPAKGTRYGSMAMTPAFIKAISAVFTASAICMGSWRGTTDVTMMTQRSSSSCVVRSPFSSPRLKTYAADAIAKIRRTPSAMSVSRVSEDTFCWENSIICMSSPWADAKPVRSTNATAPPSGGFGASFGAAPAVALTSSVPENRTDTRSAPFMSRHRSEPSGTTASFIWGVDSPVSVASFVTADPRTKTQSQGTTWTMRASLFLMASRFRSTASRSLSLLPSSSSSVGPPTGGVRRATEIKSPGRRSSEPTSTQVLDRQQSTGAALADMPDSDFNVFMRCMTVPASMNVMEKSVKPTYCQYASRSQSSDVKTWNMAMGDSSCSL
mmetsp:Transcript_11530/g.36838  ORF Transcript_11530/g.36838 Transcript_11530/m.36838 type:complete len:400 (+) Transcript_11530:74-1273(+)